MNASQAVLLDHRICDTRYPFAYTLYTKEQNALMRKYRGVFRFMADTRDDLRDAARTLDRLLNREFAVIDMNGRTRWVDYFTRLENQISYPIILRTIP